MSECPICDKPVHRCVCMNNDPCFNCGQPSGSARAAHDLLQKVINGELVLKKPRRLRSAAKFLRRVAAGGSIVSTAALSPEQIEEAREAGRLLVLSDGLGFAYLPDTPTTPIPTPPVGQEEGGV